MAGKPAPSRRAGEWPTRVLWLLVVFLVGCLPALPGDATVRRVVDGDTIELSDGRLVRYLGIDAPEVRRRDGARWVEALEPFAREAMEANRRLVDGRRVRLEYDVQSQDRFGRLLAHVYVGETLVGEALLREGWAEPLVIAPNVRYAQRFRAVADDARRAGRGRWAGR